MSKKYTLTLDEGQVEKLTTFLDDRCGMLEFSRILLPKEEDVDTFRSFFVQRKVMYKQALLELLRMLEVNEKEQESNTFIISRVCRNTKKHTVATTPKVYLDEDVALQEAELLCRFDSRDNFAVFKKIANVELSPQPVKVTRFN